MSKRREIAAFLAAALLFLLLSWGAGALLRPNRTAYGSVWPAYLRETRDSADVLFFGSSLVYCDIAPAWIWAESGLRSFVMAGPEQTIPLSYYYIREALRTQSPQIVMLELTGMFYAQYQNYTRANISYMPLSLNRIAATFTAAESALRFGLLYPLYDYHDRWTSVTADELRFNIAPQNDPYAGYTLLTDECDASTPYERDDLTAGSDVYRDNLRWLEKIRDFCAEQGSELALFIAPSVSRIPAAMLQTLREDLSERGMSLTEFNEILPELDIDDGSDWYDTLHFNVRGAEKFSRWLGRYLARRTEARADDETDALWSERLRALEEAAAAAEAAA